MDTAPIVVVSFTFGFWFSAASSAAAMIALVVMMITIAGRTAAASIALSG
jgi:hypothetical protein